jgi:hypothetical protein
VNMGPNGVAEISMVELDNPNSMVATQNQTSPEKNNAQTTQMGGIQYLQSPSTEQLISINQDMILNQQAASSLRTSEKPNDDSVVKQASPAIADADKLQTNLLVGPQQHINLGHFQAAYPSDQVGLLQQQQLLMQIQHQQQLQHQHQQQQIQQQQQHLQQQQQQQHQQQQEQLQKQEKAIPLQINELNGLSVPSDVTLAQNGNHTQQPQQQHGGQPLSENNITHPTAAVQTNKPTAVPNVAAANQNYVDKLLMHQQQAQQFQILNGYDKFLN